MFDFQSVLNPVERILEVSGEAGSILLKLAPFQTGHAFDAKRWKAMTQSQRLVDADEFMFSMGLNRIIGWDGVKNHLGEPVPFSSEMLSAWSRLSPAIDYIMQAGKATLEEAKVIEAQEKKVESAPDELPMIPNPEASEPNTPTG